LFYRGSPARLTSLGTVTTGALPDTVALPPRSASEKFRILEDPLAQIMCIARPPEVDEVRLLAVELGGLATGSARLTSCHPSGWLPASHVIEFQVIDAANQASASNSTPPTRLAEKRRRLRRERCRRPMAALCVAAVLCADAAVRSGYTAASALLRPPLERLRGHVCPFYPAISGGLPAEFGLGLLSLLDGDHDAALRDLDTALERFDALENRIGEVWCQLNRAQALHRRGRSGDAAAARAALAAADEQATRLGIDAVTDDIARVRAELEGRPIPERRDDLAQIRPARALQARTGRRALAALVRDQDDETLERRFANPRRQRAATGAGPR
jgi:hypothetical protein